MPPFLLPDVAVGDLDAYRRSGGGRALATARALGRSGTIDEIVAAGLRGRGGGGFSTGLKWRGVADAEGSRKFAVCNAAEGEPGTFKDRLLVRRNPWQLVEGLSVAAWAIGAEHAYLCTKASFGPEIEALTGAVTAMAEAGLTGEVPITLVPGPDEYLFGEEKAMLEVIEGRDPLPRLFPPYLHGLFSTAAQMGWTATEAPGRGAVPGETNPTLVNNAETLSNVPWILDRGPAWFRSMGTPDSPGTICVTIVGDVVEDTVVEVEMGTPLDVVVEHAAGGPRPGRAFKAAFSGVANPVLAFDQFAAPLSYEGMQSAGGGLGSAGFVLFDDTACMVEVARLFSRFLHVESCGQCPPCKRGSAEITAVLERVEAGVAGESDIEAMGGWLRKVTDASRCYLATEEQLVVSSILRTFPFEFEEHLDGRGCPRPRTLSLPKIVDIVDGRAVYDERQYRKQPDWTYATEPGATNG